MEEGPTPHGAIEALLQGTLRQLCLFSGAELCLGPGHNVANRLDKNAQNEFDSPFTRRCCGVKDAVEEIALVSAS